MEYPIEYPIIHQYWGFVTDKLAVINIMRLFFWTKIYFLRFLLRIKTGIDLILKCEKLSKMQKGLKAINILYFDLFRCRVGILYELGLGPSTLIFEKHKRYVGLITWGYRTENPRNYRVGPIKCIPMTHLLIQVPVLHSWSPSGRIIWWWLAFKGCPDNDSGNLGRTDSTKTLDWYWPGSK